MTCSLITLGLLAAAALAFLSGPRAISAGARRQLVDRLERWSEQTGLPLADGGLAGRWGGVDVQLSGGARGGLRLRCDLELDVPDLEVFVNARLVPPGFAFIRPDASGPARWALARREHLPFLRQWLEDEALLAELAGFLQARRARIRSGWLGQERPDPPDDVLPVLDAAADLTRRLRAAWWAPRAALAERWSLSFSRQRAGWRLTGALQGCPMILHVRGLRGELSIRLPDAAPGLQITRRGERAVGGDRVGSPLVDHLLCVRCPPPRDFLREPPLVAALLAVICGLPGAEIRDGRLTVAALPDDPRRLDEVLVCVGDLVGAWPRG